MNARALIAAALAVSALAAAEAREHRFDFGNGPLAEGCQRVLGSTTYTAERGFGWTSGGGFQERDRGGPNPLLSDMIWSARPATFRVDLPDGIYRIAITTGDMDYDDHGTVATANGGAVAFPPMRPGLKQFMTATVATHVAGHVELSFTHELNNWAVNAITISPAAEVEAARVAVQNFGQQPLTVATDPTEELWRSFLANADRPAVPFSPTGIVREDYLKLIAGNVDFFLQHQDASGAIIDPYRKEEFQCSTPAFALSAATLARHAQRADLLEPAAKAMDWACRTLGEGKTANHHEDFYPPMLAHALLLLEKSVDSARAKQWRDALAYSPDVYRAKPGGGNWNLVAAAGEAQFRALGLREGAAWVEQSLGLQAAQFTEWGMYKDPNAPMAYDLFPRMWLADMFAQGYSGAFQTEYAESMRRAAFASLFLQSPTGEWPTGGRSAGHQWNEAQQVALFEIFAHFAVAERDVPKAEVFKNAAHRAFASMARWQRPTGEMWIVKNRVDPGSRHGFESYSAHSQYNLLAAAMLSIAHEYALQTAAVKERAAPCSVGGFVVDLRRDFHKVVANSGGTYVEIDSGADLRYNPTGLLRVHAPGMEPLLGPTDGLVEGGDSDQGVFAAVGAGWKGRNGSWRSLAEFGRDDVQEVALRRIEERPDHVAFAVTYIGDFDGVPSVTEEYSIRPGAITVRTQLGGYAGPARLIVPLLADDGERKTVIEARGNAVRVGLEGSSQLFVAESAPSFAVAEQAQAFRNGWAKVAVAEHADAAALVLHILPNGSLGDAPPPEPAPESSASVDSPANVSDPQSIRDAMKRVFRYTVAHPNSAGNAEWERGALYTGVMAAHRATGDAEYLNDAKRWSNRNGWRLAENRAGFWFADNQTCAQTYLEIFMLEGGDARIAHAKAIADEMCAKPPKGREEWWWCDALYMAPPFLARLSKATGDGKYNALMNELYWDAVDYLYDDEAHLFYRDKNYFPEASRTPNGEKIFWSRGNGWVIAGLARLLDHLPEDDPRRGDFIVLFREMAAAIAPLQGADGLWRTSLHDYWERPTPETSGTAFFCYAMAWGINSGHLDRAEYEPVVRRAWEGLNRCVHDDGKLGWVQYVAGSPGPVSPYQMREYAPGAFMLAGGELLKLHAAPKETSP